MAPGMCVLGTIVLLIAVLSEIDIRTYDVDTSYRHSINPGVELSMGPVFASPPPQDTNNTIIAQIQVLPFSYVKVQFSPQFPKEPCAPLGVVDGTHCSIPDTTLIIDEYTIEA